MASPTVVMPREGPSPPPPRRSPPLRPLLLHPLLVLLLSCAGGAPRVVLGELRPQSDLTSNCFDFPANNFDRRNCIEAVNNGHTPYLPMEAGDDAIDFTLHDARGRRWNLGEALAARDMPVVMIWGMFTCPAFQGYGTDPPWDMASYWEQYQLVEKYKDRATFVHMYGPEPHPTMPGTNFDAGTTWQSYWSVVGQHRTYEERVGMAERIGALVHPEQVILPDYFPGNPYSELVQPVWCSYAMAARAVTIVSPSGELFFQRGWFHAGHVSRAIDEYWCQQQQRQQQDSAATHSTISGSGATAEEGAKRHARRKHGGDVFRGLSAALDVTTVVADASLWCTESGEEEEDEEGRENPDIPPLAR